MAVLHNKDAKSVAEQGSVVKVQVFAEKSISASGCTKLTLTTQCSRIANRLFLEIG
jgi:hypothetical protein